MYVANPIKVEVSVCRSYVNRTVGIKWRRVSSQRLMKISLRHTKKDASDFINTYGNNIMILCPNHHRIVHDYKPDFKYQLKELWYPDGLWEPLKLNIHL